MPKRSLISEMSRNILWAQNKSISDSMNRANKCNCNRFEHFFRRLEFKLKIYAHTILEMSICSLSIFAVKFADLDPLSLKCFKSFSNSSSPKSFKNKSGFWNPRFDSLKIIKCTISRIKSNFKAPDPGFQLESVNRYWNSLYSADWIPDKIDSSSLGASSVTSGRKSTNQKREFFEHDIKLA